MSISPEQSKATYIDFKKQVLLEDDIKILSELVREIDRFPRIIDRSELIKTESIIASLGYQIAGIFGRLVSQQNLEKDIFKKKVYERQRELLGNQEEKSIVMAEERARQEYDEDRQRILMFDGVIEEHKARMYSLREVHIAINHKLSILDKNI